MGYGPIKRGYQMPCQDCNCGRQSKKPADRDLQQATGEAKKERPPLSLREVTCEEEYQEWLESAERAGLTLMEIESIVMSGK
jgi:hypothetical protein